MTPHSKWLTNLEKIICRGASCLPYAGYRRSSVIAPRWQNNAVPTAPRWQNNAVSTAPRWQNNAVSTVPRWQHHDLSPAWWTNLTCARGACDGLTGTALMQCAAKACQRIQKRWAPRESCGDNLCKRWIGQEAFYKCYLTYCTTRWAP